jgi:hypothetical protein
MAMATNDEQSERASVEEIEELEPEVDGELLEVEDSSDESEVATGITPPDRRLITQPFDLAVSDLVTQVREKSSS